ncbi:MAG: manganese efflux pump MntP family protein [Eubacteriales bacterium]|nr:manganese efflux pump MntP family protein [Eubacteriales bacterium]
MDLLTLLLLAVGLSMDAFAVAICKGLAMQKLTWKKCCIVGGWFGGFQALMPFTGYVLGIQFEKYINVIAPWIAFVLLGFIGANMIREALGEDEECETDTLGVKEMFMMAVATSIDALAVGVTFACVPVVIAANAGGMFNTLTGCLMIGATTFILSVAGVRVGNVFGAKYKNRAEIAGGVILVLLGIKILLEHYGILG